MSRGGPLSTASQLYRAVGASLHSCSIFPRRFSRHAFLMHYPFLARLLPTRTTALLLLFLCWAVVTTDSQFLWWLRWTFTGGPAAADPLLTANCPARNYSLPIVVVIPLIASQTARLHWSLARWSDPRYAPCSNATAPALRVTLVFFFDRPLGEARTAAAVRQVRAVVEGEAADVIGRCFRDVQYASAGLSERDTRNTHGMDVGRNLVQTGGSNRQFEQAFQVMGGGRFRHMLYMEPDLWPIRGEWLGRVEEESRWGDFWMRGTTMRYRPRFNIGVEPFRSRYQRHLNGNALYALDDECFRRYRELVRGVYGDGAFDVAMTLYRMSMRHVMTFQAVGFRFQTSEMMVDVGVERVKEDELRQRFGGSVLVHGKSMHVKHAALNFMQY